MILEHAVEFAQLVERARAFNGNEAIETEIRDRYPVSPAYSLPRAAVSALRTGGKRNRLTIAGWDASVFIGDGRWIARYRGFFEGWEDFRTEVLPIDAHADTARIAIVGGAKAEQRLELTRLFLQPKGAIVERAPLQSGQRINDPTLWSDAALLDIPTMPRRMTVVGRTMAVFFAHDERWMQDAPIEQAKTSGYPFVAVETVLLKRALRALGTKEGATNVGYYRGPTKHSPIRIDVRNGTGGGVTRQALIAPFHYPG